MEELFQELMAAANNPAAVINSWKEKTGGKVIGCLPIYIPEEIFFAAGTLPVYLWGGNTEIDKANAHLQGFACSVVRAVLEYGLKGAYKMVDGFVFPSTCDHIQNTSDIWREVFPHTEKFDLVYPAHRQSKAAPVYLRNLYSELIVWLEAITGQKVSEEGLRESIRLYNRHRELMAGLREIRSQKPQSLTALEMSRLVKASLFMPKDQYNCKLEKLLPWLSERKVREAPRARLVLTGIMAEPDEILAIIEELGGAVVADDLALGTRLHRGFADEGAPPLEALAARHLGLGPCSTLYDPEKNRGGHLARLCRDHRADGVIFINMKFCEVEEFDYPVVKQDLEKEGIPLLFIEVEQQMASCGQLRTRLQAFLEMLT